MSDTTAEGHAHHHPNYVRIWQVLLVLLVISFVGPFFEIQIVTLVTAFGIAVVKAYLVAKNFMHLDIQPRYVVYLLTTCLVFMLLFYAGTAPDVLKQDGWQWVKPPVEHAASAGHGEHGEHH